MSVGDTPLWRYQEKDTVMEYQEREIDLIELLWKILFAWRYLLIAGIICAILLPGGMYFKNLRSYNATLEKQEEMTKAKDSMSKEEQREAALRNLKDDEKDAVEIAYISQKDYDSALKYVTTAPVMQVDAYNEEATIIEYYIDSDYKIDYNGVNKESYTSAVKDSYNNLVNGGTVASNVASMNVVVYPANYIQDLVNANSEGDDNIITISVVAPDRDSRDKIALSVKDTIESSTAKISEQIGSHSIRLINEYQVNRVDSDLLMKQKEIKSALTTAKTSLDTAKKSLTDNQKTALNSLTAIDKNETAGNTNAVDSAGNTSGTQASSSSSGTDDTTLTKPTFSIKYALIGFFAGILIVAIIIALIDILSGKLNYETELRDIFRIDTLAVFRKENRYKGIDAWLYKMKTKNKHMESYEETLKRLITKTTLLLQGKEADSVYVMGTVPNALSDDAGSRVEAGLKENGISVTFGDNISYNEEALVDAVNNGTAIVVEKLGESKVKEIATLLTTVREHEIEVVGGVVVE